MITEIEIRIWNQIAGYAAYKDSRLVYFEYDTKFPQIYDLAPIMMPRARQQVWNFDLNYATYHGLPGLLADSLPDKYGNQMIDAWFSSQGIALSELTALDRLCYLGTRAMGALEFFPNQNPISNNTKIDISKLLDISQKVLQERKIFKSSKDTDLRTLLQIGSSAGGARAKAVIAFNKETGEIRSGQTKSTKGFEPYIIKLDGVSQESSGKALGYTNIEYAYYLMAKACGIEMNQSELLEENGLAHFMTKRFDRTEQGEKLHMQTLCALAHLDYNEARVASYEILFRTANLLSLSAFDKEQIFRRMVFNVVSRNHDDHTKNFSFLMDRDAKWKLAPAYDLTFSYNPDNHWIKEHQLLVNGKSTNITKEDLLVYANKFHIKNAKQIIEEIQEQCLKFTSFAKKAKVSKERINYISKLIKDKPII